MTEDARSQERCPVCGEHRLALLDFPDQMAPDDEAPQAVLGATLAQPPEAPGIGCLACGAEWPDLAAFREAQARAS